MTETTILHEKKDSIEISKNVNLCKCGCGEEVNPGRIFVNGHQRRGERYWKMQLPPQLCECGCGGEVNPGNRFIHGHHTGNVPWTPLPAPILCACGCGEYAQPGNHFINGHNTRNRSQDLLDRIAEKNRQFYIDHPEAREAAIIKSIKFSSTKEFREYARLRAIKQFSDPLAREVIRDKMIEYWSDQSKRDAFSIVKLNSIATKEASKKQKGGNDLVCHHVAYDFNDTNALRVRISRKAHSTIHHPKGMQFSKHGYSLID